MQCSSPHCTPLVHVHCTQSARVSLDIVGQWILPTNLYLLFESLFWYSKRADALVPLPSPTIIVCSSTHAHTTVTHCDQPKPLVRDPTKLHSLATTTNPGPEWTVWFVVVVIVGGTHTVQGIHGAFIFARSARAEAPCVAVSWRYLRLVDFVWFDCFLACFYVVACLLLMAYLFPLVYLIQHYGGSVCVCALGISLSPVHR